MPKKPNEAADTRDVLLSGLYSTAILAGYLLANWSLRWLINVTDAVDVWYNIINFILSVYTVTSIVGTLGLTLVRLLRERIVWAFGPLKEKGEEVDE